MAKANYELVNGLIGLKPPKYQEADLSKQKSASRAEFVKTEQN